MSHASEQREKIALRAMFDGKMFYRRKNGETMLFADPDGRECFVLLSVQYRENRHLMLRVACDLLSGDGLLYELTSPCGSYRDFEEISLDHPDARGVLQLYRDYLQMSARRAAAGKYLIDPQRCLQTSEAPGFLANRGPLYEDA